MKQKIEAQALIEYPVFMIESHDYPTLYDCNKSDRDCWIEGAKWQKEQLQPLLDTKDAEIEYWKKERDEVVEMAVNTINEWEHRYKLLLDSHAELLEALSSMKIFMHSWLQQDENTIGYRAAIKAQAAIEKANQLNK